MNFWLVLCRLLVLSGPGRVSKRQNPDHQLRHEGRHDEKAAVGCGKGINQGQIKPGFGRRAF